jgi:hypothetical protein
MQNPIKDINGNPIINRIGSDSIISYIKEDGTTLISYMGGVEFSGGRESLKAYLDSAYYNNPYYDYSEFNVFEYFYILFDKDLNIEEIRMSYRNYADNKRFYYDSIFVDALKTSTGRWYKTGVDKEWYIYLHRQKIN